MANHRGLQADGLNGGAGGWDRVLLPAVVVLAGAASDYRRDDPERDERSQQKCLHASLARPLGTRAGTWLRSWTRHRRSDAPS